MHIHSVHARDIRRPPPPPRASVTNVSQRKCTLARLREAGLDFLENPVDQNNDVPLCRFLSSFAYETVAKLFNEDYSFFPGKRDCIAATFFSVFPFILDVN